MKTSIFTLFFLHLIVFGFSQGTSSNELSYEVNISYVPLSMTKEKLKEAHSIADLNRFYKRSWIRTFISVEVLASYQGSIKKIRSKDDVITPEQKDLMDKVDVGTDIFIKVHYIPENTLKQNDPRDFDFSFIVVPDNEASYPGGSQKLKQYLKGNAIDKIPANTFKEFALAAVKFTIDEDGQVIDAQVFESSKDEQVDALLLATVSKMPSWKPATYANGTKAKQEFVLTVGDHRSCIINTLNIRRN